MKKIIISLAIIAAVAAIAISATTSFFSDEEKSIGNTFSAGTIDIAIDSQNPWTSNYSIGDLKPGETGYINFDITNVGQNPVNVSKNLSNWNESTGTVSEPECTDQGGYWDNPNGGCNWNWNGTHTDKNDVQSQIIYDLSVKVYATNSTSTPPIWWQAIYTDSDNKSIADVYGTSSPNYVALGMIPVGGLMEVTQSYHFATSTSNAYQGDTLSFDITIKGDQMPQESGYTSVALENKVQGENSIWDIVQADGIEGTLSYKTQGPTFDYTFSGKVKTNGNYTLLYVGSTNNYPCDGSKVLGTGEFTTTSGTLSGQVDTGSITNGKIWLIPTSSYVGSVMTSWPAADILFETGLINYVKN